MREILKNVNKVKITTAEFDNSTGYGRIVEEKDCSTEEKNIKKINGGIYAFDIETLCKYLPYLSNNNSQNEYYLTDIVEIIKTNENIEIDMFNITPDKHHEIMGINTTDQLLELEKLMV